MLNLLIAIMSDSYEKVKESEVVEARKLRAQTIIDEEVLMSDAERSNPVYFPQLAFHAAVPGVRGRVGAAAERSALH